MKETFDFSYVYFHLFMFSPFFLLPLLCFFEGGAIIGSQAVLFAFLMMPHAGCLSVLGCQAGEHICRLLFCNA